MDFPISKLVYIPLSVKKKESPIKIALVKLKRRKKMGGNEVLFSVFASDLMHLSNLQKSPFKLIFKPQSRDTKKEMI